MVSAAEIICLIDDSSCPIDHVREENVPLVVQLGDVPFEADGQFGVGLDQRPERVSVLELVPEARLCGLVATAGQQGVDLVRAEADRVEDADVGLDLSKRRACRPTLSACARCCKNSRAAPKNIYLQPAGRLRPRGRHPGQ